MYETALPPETRNLIRSMEPSRLVIGIPSYRNIATVGAVVNAVAQGLDRYYRHLEPVLVNADGHSFDQTLDLAMKTPVPASVRRIGTRYHGLPGKGSAIRSIMEVATLLGARTCAIIEADVTTVTPDWIPVLVGPVVSGEFDMILPHYLFQRPLAGSNDLLAHPLLHALFGADLRTPMAGEFAMRGFLAGRMCDKDVWETDVARAGLNSWITTTAILEGYKLGQVRLGERLHVSAPIGSMANRKFLQQVGTLFRLTYLYRKFWRQEQWRRSIPLHDRWQPGARASANSWPSAKPVKAAIQKSMNHDTTSLWARILLPENLARVHDLIEHDHKPFPADLWAKVVYDFFVVYNQGEGDPDRVIEALIPLYHARLASFLEAGMNLDEDGRDALIAEQAAVFDSEFPYLLNRASSYVPWSRPTLHPQAVRETGTRH